MSVAVSLDRLREEIARLDSPTYLLTVGPDGRPHSVTVQVSWIGHDLVMTAGNSTVANAAARPLVSLLWPPVDAGGYSLIVDGTVTSAAGTGQHDNSVTVQPTKAVWHRAATTPGGEGSSRGDCLPL